MSYLHGAGAAGGTRARDIGARTEGGVACPTVGGGTTVAVAAGSVARGGKAASSGEDGLTQGLKGGLWPPLVFAMARSGAGE